MWLLCTYTTCSVIICSFEPMIDPYYFGRLYLYYLSDHYRYTLLLCPQRFITLQIINLYCSFDERVTRTTLFDLYSILLIICYYNILILQMYVLCLYRLINCLIAINYFIYSYLCYLKNILYYYLWTIRKARLYYLSNLLWNMILTFFWRTIDLYYLSGNG